MMRARLELFCRDLTVVADFYVRALGFVVERDSRPDHDFLVLRRDDVLLSLAGDPRVDPARRHPPPLGVEIVLEVDDLEAERDRVVAGGWPLDTDIERQHWGLRDFRMFDPEGHYLRVSSTAA